MIYYLISFEMHLNSTAHLYFEISQYLHNIAAPLNSSNSVRLLQNFT